MKKENYENFLQLNEILANRQLQLPLPPNVNNVQHNNKPNQSGLSLLKYISHWDYFCRLQTGGHIQ